MGHLDGGRPSTAVRNEENDTGELSDETSRRFQLRRLQTRRRDVQLRRFDRQRREFHRQKLRGRLQGECRRVLASGVKLAKTFFLRL